MAYPPAISTDTQSTHSVMAYQIYEALFDSCGGDESISVRLELARARALGQKGVWPESAKVGYCPCCALATHTAAPLRYEEGEFPNEKARGLMLWRKNGPWAARRFAA